jgi:hypothetical protein
MVKKGIFFLWKKLILHGGHFVCTLPEDFFVYKGKKAFSAIHNSYSDGILDVVYCRYAEYFAI